jgi:hypothetical protein
MFVGVMQDDGTTQIFEAGLLPSILKPQAVLLMIGGDSVERIEACFVAVQDILSLSTGVPLAPFAEGRTSHYVYAYFADETPLSWGNCFYVGKGLNLRWLDHVKARAPSKTKPASSLKEAMIDKWVSELGLNGALRPSALSKLAANRLVYKLGQWTGPYSELQSFAAEYFLITCQLGPYALSNRTQGNSSVSEVRILGRNAGLFMHNPAHVRVWTRAVAQVFSDPFAKILSNRIEPGLHLLANQAYLADLASSLAEIDLHPEAMSSARRTDLEETPAHYSVEGAADPCLTFSTHDDRPYRFQLKLSMHSADVMVNVRSKLDGVAGARRFEAYFRDHMIAGRPLSDCYGGKSPISLSGSPDPYFKPFAKDANGKADTKFSISGVATEQDVQVNWHADPLPSSLQNCLKAFLDAFPSPATLSPP